MLNFLSGHYEKEELNTDFYADRFKSFLSVPLEEQSEEERQKFELIFTDLLSQWDALLQAKILAYQLTKFEEEEAQYSDDDHESGEEISEAEESQYSDDDHESGEEISEAEESQYSDTEGSDGQGSTNSQGKKGTYR